MDPDRISLEEAARLTGVAEEDLRAAIVIGHLAGPMSSDDRTFTLSRDNAQYVASLVRAMRFSREVSPRAGSGDWVCRLAVLIGVLIGGHLVMELAVRAYLWLR